MHLDKCITQFYASLIMRGKFNKNFRFTNKTILIFCFRGVKFLQFGNSVGVFVNNSYNYSYA
jgi:hypothetical protein